MATEYEDKNFVCMMCEAEFIWTKGEQGFINDLKDKGKIQFVIPPKRCAECREKKKQEKAIADLNNGYPL